MSSKIINNTTHVDNEILQNTEILQQTAYDVIRFDRHEFVNTMPLTAVPCVIILTLASVIGTFGNILTLVVIAKRKKMRNAAYIFIVNLAISDLYVTLVADPMSIVAKFEGEHFFDSVPGLCQIVASICTISCVSSLMNIAAMSINRYFFICKHETYKKIFTNRNCILICISLYTIGTILVLLNSAGIGDHNFDRKSLECIWDRMATFPYTIVFSITLVWIPSIATGISYLKIYIYVRNHRRKIEQQQRQQQQRSTLPSAVGKHHNLHLARTLFIIFTVFFACWAPYALLMVIDSDNTFSHAIHVYITMFAHLHSSLNWLIYYLTNKRFADACKQLLNNCGICRLSIKDVMNTFQKKYELIHKRHSRLSTKSTNGLNRLDIPMKTINGWKKSSCGRITNQNHTLL